MSATVPVRVRWSRAARDRVEVPAAVVDGGLAVVRGTRGYQLVHLHSGYALDGNRLWFRTRRQAEIALRSFLMLADWRRTEAQLRARSPHVIEMGDLLCDSLLAGDAR